MKRPYLLTFWGGASPSFTARYRRWHPTYDAAREEALRVLAALPNRAAHPAVIDGPDLGPQGVTVP